MGDERGDWWGGDKLKELQKGNSRASTLGFRIPVLRGWGMIRKIETNFKERKNTFIQ